MLHLDTPGESVWTPDTPAPGERELRGPEALSPFGGPAHDTWDEAAVTTFGRDGPSAPSGGPAPQPAEYTMPVKDAIALVDLLTGLVEYQDPYFRGSSSFTRHVAGSVARRLGLGDDSLVALSYAALLRDVGRMAMNGMLIPATATPGSDERYRIQRHVTLGLELLEGVELPPATREAIRHHHEQWDGNGYPDRLAGTQIPILSRILHVADSFVAAISARPYRPPKRVDEAVRELREGAGHAYDPAVVDALITVVQAHEYRTTGFGLHDHVLIVHPDQPRAIRLTVELCSRGYLAEVAPDLASACARLPGVPLGAVLVAGRLADADGADFVSHVRAISRFREVPVLAIDLPTADDRIRMIHAGADACFSADCQPEELLATLGATIRRARRTVPGAAPFGDGWDLPGPGAATARHPAEAGDTGAASGLQGSLHDFPLSWLLQTLQYDGRSARVSIHTSAGAGSITLSEGVLHHAETDWSSGEAAFNEILDWVDGIFRVHPSVEPGPRTISRQMMHLLLDHAARHDEAKALFGAVATG